MTVYLLTSGEWSCIEGIFSSRDAADRYVEEAIKGGSDIQYGPVEEYDLDACQQYTFGPIYNAYARREDGEVSRFGYVKYDMRHPTEFHYSESDGDSGGHYIHVSSPVSFEDAERMAVEKWRELYASNAAGGESEV